MLSSAIKSEGWMEEALIVAGLIFVQATCAAYTVFIAGLLASGLEPLFLVAASGFTGAFLLLPFAIALEKKIWPPKISLHLTVRFALIAFGGMPLYQVFMLLGVKKTTPAVATAMPNLAPGLIFIIASCLRIEKFSIKCKYTRYKIMGVLICFAGAMTMSFLQGPSIQPRVSLNLKSMMGQISGINSNSNEWIMGCVYLLMAAVALSSVMVLQAATMTVFPAPISLCVLATLMGSFFTMVFQLISQGNINTGASSIGIAGLVNVVLVGGFMSCVSTSIVVICIHKKGPVFVSIFHPIQTVCAAILSAVIVRQFISLGSLIGMALLFSGLYIVLLAKIKEAGDEVERVVSDEERPLLC